MKNCPTLLEVAFGAQGDGAGNLKNCPALLEVAFDAQGDGGGNLKIALLRQLVNSSPLVSGYFLKKFPSPPKKMWLPNKKSLEFLKKGLRCLDKLGHPHKLQDAVAYARCL